MEILMNIALYIGIGLIVFALMIRLWGAPPARDRWLAVTAAIIFWPLAIIVLIMEHIEYLENKE